MQIINADPSRMITLPGVGPCPRPVDIDTKVTGFKALKSLRIYEFSKGLTIAGDSEIDEVYVLPVCGAISLAITGAHALAADLRQGGPQALYMPPDHSYRLTAQENVLVAYARAEAGGLVATHVTAKTGGDGAETLRFARLELADGAVLSVPGLPERLIHVIAGAISANGQRVVQGQTLALGDGEVAEVAGAGAASVLLVHV